MVVNFALLFLADLLKQPDDELIVCVEEFFKFSFWNKGREFLKNVVQCSAVYFFVIWYCHYLLTFETMRAKLTWLPFCRLILKLYCSQKL